MDKMELLRKRHSVRAYKKEELPEDTRNRLRAVSSFVNSHEAGLKFVPVFNDKGPFKGIGRSYGMFKGVNNYLAVIIDPTFEYALERAGYYAEQFVMEATKLGLGTCIVSGTFSKEHVDVFMEVYEKVPFVVAFGISDIAKTPFLAKLSGFILQRNKRPDRDFFDGDETDYKNALQTFPWLIKALEAVACAPSAVNSQPVRLKMSEAETINERGNRESKPQIVAFTTEPNKYAIELGIAKFNVSFAIGGIWDWGEMAPLYPDSE